MRRKQKTLAKLLALVLILTSVMGSNGNVLTAYAEEPGTTENVGSSTDKESSGTEGTDTTNHTGESTGDTKTTGDAGDTQGTEAQDTGNPSGTDNTDSDPEQVQSLHTLQINEGGNGAAAAQQSSAAKQLKIHVEAGSRTYNRSALYPTSFYV